MQSLLEKIEQQVMQSGAETVGVAVYDCSSGQTILFNPDVPFHPASTFKICVMMEVFHQAHQGLFSLEDALTIKNEFHSIVDQSLFSVSIAEDSETDLYTFLGSSKPIRDILIRMITHSSNLATNLLIERVTPHKVTAFMHELGVEGLLVRRGLEDNKALALGLYNAATSRALMQIMTRLADHQVVSEEASEEMIAIMKQQHYNEGIPASLPAEVSVAHKTGWNGLLYHDVAIIYPPGHKSYVLVVMTRGLSDQKEAPLLVSSLSRLIYDHQIACDPGLEVSRRSQVA